MKSVGELLREADPLQYEPGASAERRDFQRAALLAAASGKENAAPARARLALIAAIVALFIGSLIGVRVWSPFINDVHAAVRFEVRLAEDRLGPGLREAKVTGSNRSVYLHDEVIVNNSDISAAHVVENNGSYSVSVQFNPAGAQKMGLATQDNIGKHVAILLDGQIVMVPVIRSAISDAAMLTELHLTKAEAERIVKGITTE